MPEVIEEKKTFDISILRNIEVMEQLVSKQAKDLAVKRYNVPPHLFEIHLSRDLGGNIMRIQPGHIVHVWIQWPHALLELNSILRDALEMIKKHNLRRSMEIIPYSLAKQFSTDIRAKWRKEIFSDESDIILDLIPRNRVNIIESTTITLEDAKTGERISITREGKKHRFDGEDVGLWMQLSRIVRDKYPEIPEVDSKGEDENNDSTNG